LTRLERVLSHDHGPAEHKSITQRAKLFGTNRLILRKIRLLPPSGLAGYYDPI